ncbi:26S proteasome non-ATPase regulatory subunit 9 [Mortierella sp. GBA43]|nr:26S proteasome non-ATPase regulatory subunit 9 [Mortierella sp. GBA43]
MASTQSEAMARAQALMKQKSDIEAEIKQAQDDLQSQKVGMQDRLVDDNGFPRSDVDLVVVTTARSNIIKLRNDLKTTMDQIEKALHEVHAEALAEKKKQQEQEAEERKRQGGTNGTDSSSSTTSSTAQGRGNQLLPPFARVNSVAPDSPAREAGLLVDDRIVSFGIINANTPNVLPSLGAHVQSRENVGEELSGRH